MRDILPLSLVFALLLPACSGGPGGNGPDGDADADSDADGDTDADTDADTEPERCDAPGFAGDTTSWSLPEIVSGNDWMEELSTSVGCDGDGLAVSTLDLTGDGRPDLVVTDLCDRAGVGTTRWEVHENTGSGFSDDPISWSLPQVYDADDWMDSTAEDVSCGQSRLTISIVDLTGDARPDLVFTDACDYAGVGTEGWMVFENTGSGFADDGIPWRLPALGDEDDVFDQLSADSYCGSGELNASLLDLDGDGALDLVVTDSCDTAGVGTTRWDVYENTGEGFATEPTSWSLPDGGTSDWLDEAAESASCGSGRLEARVIDLTADGKPDLVFTDGCDAADIGTDSWGVFENTGDGFADEAIEWTLPQIVSGDDWMDDLATDVSCDDSELIVSVADVDGDLAPDLLVTDHCDRTGVGTARWDAWLNVADGFDDEPVEMELPELLSGDDWMDATAVSHPCDGDTFAASAFDIDGDGLLDLVVTDLCDAGSVGTTRWEVAFGECG